MKPLGLIMIGTDQIEMKLHKQSSKISAALDRIEKLELDIKNLKKVLENVNTTR